MNRMGIAKIFRNGRSQAVRLPKEFRFDGDRVRVRKVAQGVLLEPLIDDPRKWLSELDRLSKGEFMANPKERRQPRAPKREVFE